MSTFLPPSLADFCGVLAESKRIINAHSRHFLVLSVLFLLPLSFSLAAFPTLFHSLSSSSNSDHNHVKTLVRLVSASSAFPHHHHQIQRFFFYHLRLSIKTVAFSILYASFVLLLFICAAGSVTYSIFHGFYGRPVKLSPAIRSLSTSYFRLLATLIVSLVILFVVFGVFALFEFLLFKAIELLVVSGTDQSPLDSPYFLIFSSVGSLALVLILTNLAVNWILIGATTVIESRWGIDCLIRSKNLVRGMRWTAIPIILFFGVAAMLLLCVAASSSSSYVGGGASDVISGSDGGEWRRWAFVAQIVVTSALFTLMLLHGLAASTVLYMYCKAVQGELAEEIVKEFASEYVSLSFCDDKVPRLVSIVANHSN